LGEEALMERFLIPASYIGPVIAILMGITYALKLW
jgi:hypothetical protein